MVDPSCRSTNLLIWFWCLAVPCVVSLVSNVTICWYGYTHRIYILCGRPILLTTLCNNIQDVDSFFFKNQQTLPLFNIESTKLVIQLWESTSWTVSHQTWPNIFPIAMISWYWVGIFVSQNDIWSFAINANGPLQMSTGMKLIICLCDCKYH